MRTLTGLQWLTPDDGLHISEAALRRYCEHREDLVTLTKALAASCGWIVTGADGERLMPCRCFYALACEIAPGLAATFHRECEAFAKSNPPQFESDEVH